jgi:hypothetical protein
MAQSPVIFIAAGALIAYFLYTRINLYLARQRIMKENGCKPCKSVFNKDPVFGIDVIKVMTTNSKEHVVLKENKKRFEEYGNTFWTRAVTLPIIATCEPENVKTILSLKFKDYSFGNRDCVLATTRSRHLQRRWRALGEFKTSSTSQLCA